MSKKYEFHPYSARLDRYNFRVASTTIIVIGVISLLLYIQLTRYLTGDNSNDNFGIIAAVSLILIETSLAIFAHSIVIRRLHDIGWSWFEAQFSHPFPLPLFREGEKNDNKYGKTLDERLDIRRIIGFYPVQN